MKHIERPGRAIPTTMDPRSEGACWREWLEQERALLGQIVPPAVPPQATRAASRSAAPIFTDSDADRRTASNALEQCLADLQLRISTLRRAVAVLKLPGDSPAPTPASPTADVVRKPR